MDDNNKEWLVVKEGSEDITKANQIMKLEWTKELGTYIKDHAKEIDSGELEPLLEYRRQLLVKSAKQYNVSDATNGKLKEIVEWEGGVSVEHPLNATDTPSRGQNDVNITDYTSENKDNAEKLDETKEKGGRDGVTVDLQDPSTV
jgi:hypothetical protein